MKFKRETKNWGEGKLNLKRKRENEKRSANAKGKEERKEDKQVESMRVIN